MQKQKLAKRYMIGGPDVVCDCMRDRECMKMVRKSL